MKGIVRTTFYECQAPAWTALAKLSNLQSLWTDKTHSRTEIVEAGRDIARLNSAYLLRIQQSDAQDKETRRMETLLSMPPQPQWNFLVARVIRRDLDTWWQRIIVQRGAGDGIKVGDGVVNRDGVVGRVVEVHSSTSVVELVSSASFRVAAHVDGDMRPVTYVGSPAPAFRDPGGVASNVPADIVANTAQPVRLVTSRLGGAFPDGLTIGMMRNMEREPDGLFQRAWVILNPNLVSVQEVAILVPQKRANTADPGDDGKGK
jgi:rod shape-determining protein MreC